MLLFSYFYNITGDVKKIDDADNFSKKKIIINLGSD